MRTIQMILDDDLVEAVDRLAKKLKTTCSAFTRKALREAIKLFAVLIVFSSITIHLWINSSKFLLFLGNGIMISPLNAVSLLKLN